MIWILYNLLFPLAFLLMLPKFLSRMARRGGYKKHFEQRFGLYGHGTTARLAEGRHIWIHAVSVGELFVALRFVEEYRKVHPEALFVISTNTSTGHKLAKQKLDSRDVLIYFPLDFPFVMKRVFSALNPLRLILVECEFWPNMIREAQRRNIPVALINGRISDSSFGGYKKIRLFTDPLLKMIDLFCMQGQQDAERVIALGARPETVKAIGTAKYDLQPSAADAAAPARAVLQQAGVPDDALVLLGASTWPGEEEALCKIYKTLREKHPNLFLVLVPRHAERRDDVVSAIEGQELTCSLRSQNISKSDVLVIDTTGELMSFYAASDVVFVGKSLCKHGGQNPIEPALFGRPIVVGPNMENFPSVMDDFLSANALRQVADFQTLEKTIDELLGDEPTRAELGAAARQVLEDQRGVIANMVEQIG
ncbi:MAG: 3-deoxy-D-manno-octulosonic acid transferase [Kiritimatiellales bacterium]|nr:3-deoxy-D-manno-octulosonic acid transferase [Kiritimatiellota bacterium]MBL7011501.1 3-deoxy-D-manno-octulosonic acid transferase [Kiritimatiellales bacterium]